MKHESNNPVHHSGAAIEMYCTCFIALDHKWIHRCVREVKRLSYSSISGFDFFFAASEPAGNRIRNSLGMTLEGDRRVQHGAVSSAWWGFGNPPVLKRRPAIFKSGNRPLFFESQWSHHPERRAGGDKKDAEQMNGAQRGTLRCCLGCCIHKQNKQTRRCSLNTEARWMFPAGSCRDEAVCANRLFLRERADRLRNASPFLTPEAELNPVVESHLTVGSQRQWTQDRRPVWRNNRPFHWRSVARTTASVQV